MLLITLILTNIVLVQSQWYLGEEKQQNTTNLDTKDASKPVLVTSPVECILKCKRKGMDNFYVKDKNECFCLKSQDQAINSDGESMQGIVYKQYCNEETYGDSNPLVIKDKKKLKIRKATSTTPVLQWADLHIYRLDVKAGEHRLGDIFIFTELDNTMSGNYVVSPVNPSDNDIFKVPISYEKFWMLGDSAFWRPTCPAGYARFGILGTVQGKRPVDGDIYCVKEEYTLEGSIEWELLWKWDRDASNRAKIFKGKSGQPEKTVDLITVLVALKNIHQSPSQKYHFLLKEFIVEEN
eukprot:TCONS_00052115-protein